jgi:integrase/recombinase XerD
MPRAGSAGKRPLPSPTAKARAVAAPGLAATTVAAATPVVALVEDFIVARKPLKGSPHTEAAYRRDLAGVSAHLATGLGVGPSELVLGQLDAKALRQAFASFSEGHAASSIARAWSAWDQFFGFLVADDLVVGNPMAAVAKPKVPRRAPKALQGEATPERLLGSLAGGDDRGGRRWPERDLAFVAMALLTGLRLSELLGLDVGSLDGRKGERRLRVVGKGSKVRFVPIEAPLEALVSAYLKSRRARFPSEKTGPSSPLFVDRKGGRLQRGGAQYLASAYRSAGVGASVPKGALVHALRHTMATRLAEDGASASEIQHLLGHESLATSQLYIDSTANEQRAAARANRTYQVLEKLTKPSPSPTARPTRKTSPPAP